MSGPPTHDRLTGVLGEVRLVLASGSPRRRQLLAEAGIEVDVRPPDVDDGQLRSGTVAPEGWVAALAYLKARRVAEQIAGELVDLGDRRGTIVLGADTVCVQGTVVLGQPADAVHARAMLGRLIGTEHRTLTGVAVLAIDEAGRVRDRALHVDGATVRLGDPGAEVLEAYMRGDAWRGKAGAYNLRDRLDAGWPIECDGDPTTVMGLPMERLPAWLEGSASSLPSRRRRGDRAGSGEASC